MMKALFRILSAAIALFALLGAVPAQAMTPSGDGAANEAAVPTPNRRTNDLDFLYNMCYTVFVIDVLAAREGSCFAGLDVVFIREEP